MSAAPPYRVLDLFSGYTLSEDGTVIGPRRKPIAPQIGKLGYVRVEIRGKKYLLHRLLAQAFIPNPGSKPQVNHINGDKADNRLANLEWVTRSENQLHAYRSGLQVGHKKPTPLSDAHKAALCGSRWKRERHVYQLEARTFANLYEAAAAFGVSRQTVLNRCKSPRYPSWTKSVERF